MSLTNVQTALPAELEFKLTDFRQRVALVKLAEGALAALCGLIVSYLLVFLLDRVMETPVWLRFLLLILGVSPMLMGLPLKWYQWVWQLRELEAVARLLKRTFPILGDRLLGVVELVHRPENSMGRSERLVTAAIAQTAEAVKDQDFRNAVPNAHHRQWGLAALAGLLLVLLAFSTVSQAARNALVRWGEPWRHVERFTFAQINALPAAIVVPYDEPFTFPVHLASDTRWSPGTGWGDIYGQPLLKSFLTEGAYSFAIPPQKEDVSLDLSMGDVRKTVLIQPRTRPELSEIQVHLKLPDYLGYKSQLTSKLRGGLVSIVKGSQASFEATAIRDIDKARLNNQDLKVDDGKIVTNFELINSDVDKNFFWSDHDGLTPHEALVIKVRAVDDQPPTIIARRDTLEQVVLDSEVVTFNLTAEDDYGVKQVGLEWIGSDLLADGKPFTGSKLVGIGANEQKESHVGATFCAVRDGVAPQTLEIRGWATDYFPNRAHSHSAAMILHILNKTDHALWLTQQFGRWLDAAKETYEREQELNEANKELRALTPEDLDRPENRRKVSEQAAQETANASRLGSLNDVAKSLVEQATKNDEFDAKRLESLATLLKSLQNIAANRMPNVSDLLKSTASASRGSLPNSHSSTTPPSNSSNSTPPNTAPNTAQVSPPPGDPNSNNSTPPQNTTPNLVQATPPPGGNSKMMVGNNASNSQNPPPPPADGANKPPAPALTDHEAGYFPKTAPANQAPKPPSLGRLTLPTTQLDAAPGQKNDPPPATTPAEQQMDHALKEQGDLLAEFSKVSDQLAAIMTSLDASTFVKRFKAASKAQQKIASSLTQTGLSSFGSFDPPGKSNDGVIKQTKDQSDIVRVIESDLDAYYERKHDERFKHTRDEMRDSNIVESISTDGDRCKDNFTGEAIAGSQYWADTLDRWAEEMVGASNCKCKSSGSSDSLPPEIVLKVMQALRGEMSLRDETREVENVKAALDPKDYNGKAQGLATTQSDPLNLIASAGTDIMALDQGEQKFAKELKLLHAAGAVMDETRGILSTPETGPKAIAAETEAIEILLQSKRSGNKGGGGGGGSNAGGGGTALTDSEAALAEFGPGADAQTTVPTREVTQATGQSGKEFPDEFKTGLDNYFGNLEKQVTK